MVCGGIALRFFLAVFTEGTKDVSLWAEFARGIAEQGLLGEYRAAPALNHPPFAAWAASWLWRLSLWSGIPFRIIFRIPVALADVGSGLVLLLITRGNPYRWIVFGSYELHPLAMILSAYHGNTDSAMAFLVLASLLFATAGRSFLCGLFLGLSLWVKLPGALAAPAIILSLPRLRQRAVAAATALLVGASTYVPACMTDPALIADRVFRYPGTIVQTPARLRIWGIQNFLWLFNSLPRAWWPSLAEGVDWYFRHNTLVVLAPLFAYAFLRRRERPGVGVGRTVAVCYSILYALSSSWSFQYLAWSVPFWFLAGPLFLIGASLLAGGYVYGVYALDCGNPFLLGPWDFMGHPDWPRPLILLRDLSVLFFLACVTAAFYDALRQEWRARLQPPLSADGRAD